MKLWTQSIFWHEISHCVFNWNSSSYTHHVALSLRTQVGRLTLVMCMETLLFMSLPDMGRSCWSALCCQMVLTKPGESIQTWDSLMFDCISLQLQRHVVSPLNFWDLHSNPITSNSQGRFTEETTVVGKGDIYCHPYQLQCSNSDTHIETQLLHTMLWSSWQRVWNHQENIIFHTDNLSK